MLIVALPPASPPARVVAGVHVTWPLTKPETTADPGWSLTVRIKSKRRRATVALVRVNDSGRTMRRVAAKTLRTGSFTTKIPDATPGARYALRLTVAGHKRWSWITTRRHGAPIDQVSAPAPVATPPPFCGSQPELPSSAFNGEVQLAATSVRAGDPLSYAVANVGEGKLGVGPEAALYPDGGSRPPVSAVATSELAPGSALARSLPIPADTPPGRYRLQQVVVIAQCDYLYPAAVSSPAFEVVP